MRQRIVHCSHAAAQKPPDQGVHCMCIAEHCRALLHPCEPLAMSRLGQVDCSTMYALCAFDASLDRITVFITGKLMLLGCNNVQV